MSSRISNGCRNHSPRISDESDVFLALRKNWCCILEEIIECPICLDIPLSNIYQCSKGHNICDICRELVTYCPICSSYYTNTRNRCVEEIVQKLEDIKVLILDPSSDVEKCNRTKKKSEGSQTEEILMKTNCVPDSTDINTSKLKQQKSVRRKSL